MFHSYGYLVDNYNKKHLMQRGSPLTKVVFSTFKCDMCLMSLCKGACKVPKITIIKCNVQHAWFTHQFFTKIETINLIHVLLHGWHMLIGPTTRQRSSIVHTRGYVLLLFRWYHHFSVIFMVAH